MEGLPPSNLWIDPEKTGHNRQAKYELLKLLPEDVFDTPKPVKLMIYILGLIKDDSAIVVDFFSGSSTMAEAVMQKNAVDGGKRKYIMIQLPEDLDDSLKKASNDKKTVLKNAIDLCDKLGRKHVLTEVAKERINRSADCIKNNTNVFFDDGFRVLKIDSSNMKDVYYRPADTEQTLLDVFTDNIKEDRTPEDLLFQVMLDLGVLLSSKIEETEIAGKKVFNVADGFLIACFDKDITDETIKAVANMKPYYAVFRDSSMANDSVATNFDQIFANISPDTIRKVL